MDSKERAELVRQGNAAFNAKDYPKAKECFTKANYGDGLVRLGDYYMFERRLPLLAYGYYKKAGAQTKIDDIKRRMIGAIGVWLGQDKIKPDSLAMAAPSAAAKPTTAAPGMVDVPVSPELRDLARKLAGV
ncbi:MAG: hypothetical protein HY042_08965 [Spirochaetia bacterium]|nr:hypothetical protein [Spirochaetia bacterium]